MDAYGFEPGGPRNASDRGCAPDTRHDKGPTWCKVHKLSRADARDGMHSDPDEQGQMGIGTQAPIGHEHVSWV
jgi:hypothetical protein